MDCLPYDISMRLKKVIIEFFNIFNSYPRFDFYTIQNVDNINKDERFIQWQKTSREIISLAIEHLRKNCDENYNFVK